MNNSIHNVCVITISTILCLNTTIMSIHQQKNKKNYVTRQELFKRIQYRAKKNSIRPNKKIRYAEVATEEALIQHCRQSIFCSPTTSYRRNEKLIQKIAQNAVQQTELEENLALNQHQTLTALAHINGSTPLFVQHKPQEIMIHPIL